MLRASVLSIVTLLSFSCDPLVGPEYLGEPMIELAGEVENTLVNAPSTEIAVAWLVNDFSGRPAFFRRATAVPVEGEFPAGFTMSIYEPPPGPAFGGFTELHQRLDSSGEARLAVGFILALRTGAHLDLDNLREHELLGVSDEQLLIYIENASIPDGYHLIRLPEDDEFNNDQFYECVSDSPAGRCLDGCYADENECYFSCEGGPEPCFESCNTSFNACDGSCIAEFGYPEDGCFDLTQIEQVPHDSLRVRMFEDASTESVWAALRPEDCAAISQQILDCVTSCSDANCEDACFSDDTACGFTGTCEVVQMAIDKCFNDCFLEDEVCFACDLGPTACVTTTCTDAACTDERVACCEGQTVDECFADTNLCYDGCNARADPLFEACSGL